MKNPFESWGKNSKKIIMGTVMMGSMNASSSPISEIPKITEGKNIEVKSEIKKGHDDKTYDINNEEYKNVVDSINLEQYCKTGSIEFVSPEARENAINTIADFFKNVDFKNYFISVVGLCSHERPTPNNDVLRENRRRLGIEMVTEALNKIFPQDKVEEVLKNLESSSKEMSIFDLGITRDQFENMDSETLNNLIDQTQGIKINLKKIEKIKNLEYEIKIPEPFENVVSVILDNSKSMEGEAKEALKIIGEINEKYKKDIQVVSLEGGNQEAHLKTLIDILSNIEIQKENNKEVLVITDEPDNAVLSEEEYNIKVKQVLELAEIKNISVVIKVFHPDQKIGGSKMVNLKDYPQVLFIDQKFRKNGSSSVFWESKTKAWYDSLPNKKIDPSI